MRNRWSDADAKSFIDRYAPGWGEDLALRVYTSRLIGMDPDLVMHGGGNTSVKSIHTNIFGEKIEGLFVKGSGWNLDSIEPAGLPGLDLNYLRKLRALEKLGDEDMVNELRARMFDASGPNPSVETLLHAFLPPKFVDHSHADAILILSNQKNGEAQIRGALGSKIAIVPYVPPGFELSKIAAEIYEQNPSCEGLVLMHHGFFTFGQSAKESYDRHIQYVQRAEDHIANKTKTPTRVPTALGNETRNAAAALPLLRNALALPLPVEDSDQLWKRVVLDYRTTDEILAFVNSPDLKKLSQTGPLTPDHIIRTKQYPLILENPDYENPDRLKKQIADALNRYRADYDAYFKSNVEKKGVEKTRLDSLPRVILLPGAGMFCAGVSRKDAAIAADIYEHTLRAKIKIAGMGEYEMISESEFFDMEYWSLEQAKLGKAAEKILARQIAVVTGAAGAIGISICEGLLQSGAHVMLWDINKDALTKALEHLRGKFGASLIRALQVDVTKEDAVKSAMKDCLLRFGGLDILVLNAGIAHSGPLDTLEEGVLDRVMDVNFKGYFLCMKHGTQLMKAQGLGGNIIVNSSKNVFAPGKEFSAYSASKAAGHQMAKIAALELAPFGIRVNLINADGIFDGSGVPSGLWEKIGPERAKTRGIEADEKNLLKELREYYRNRNLLKTEVRGRHVAAAVVFFASNQIPSTGATLPVDGGIPEAFPR